LSWSETVVALQELPCTADVVAFDEVDSTNSEAMSLGLQGAPSGTIVVANRQRRGRGRLGRTWYSMDGDHISMSVLWRLPWQALQAPQVTLDAAVSVARCIEEWRPLRPTLKWPNDVLIAGRKCAGLLGEMRANRTALDFVVIGIGLNVDPVPDNAPEGLASIATSMSDGLGHRVDRKDVYVSLVQNLALGYDRLIDRDTFDRDGWHRYAATLGHRVTVMSPGTKPFHGTATTLTEMGSLLVRLDNGEQREVIAGDVLVQTGGDDVIGR
jgi:BirA family biotin operon repressor/biotin-[acetyl-CoA-carboxylase] ligase